MKRVQAVRRFLEEKRSSFFNLIEGKLEDHELQINVAQDGGEKVQRQFTFTDEQTGDEKTINWWGYTSCKNHAHLTRHGMRETWKSFRIPYQSKVAHAATYEDRELKFSTDHFEAIGLSGWNWREKKSEWVGFDFDSVANHSQGLSNEELNGIRQAIGDIDWVTTRKSTSGKGLHFYVYLNPAVTTNSHSEHAALARSILGILSARIGKKLDAKVDTCGGILWVWHRRQSPDGFTILKDGQPLSDVPINWKDHLEVIGGKRKTIRNPTVTDVDDNALEDLMQKTRIADLDDGHRQIIGWLISNNRMAYWNNDKKLLVAHTFDLQECHRALKLKGPFYTIAKGTGNGSDQNCFAYPLRNSGWVVRRHTRKTPEHPSWTIDSSGWSRCYLNVAADLSTASRCHEGVERTDGRFEIPSLTQAITVLSDLGGVIEELKESPFLNRPATLKQHKDGRAILSVVRQGTDTPPSGWYEGQKQTWEKIVNIQNEAPEIEVPDSFVRHLVVSGRDSGWYIYTRGSWIFEGEHNVRRAMLAANVATKSNIEEIRGQCVLHPWYLVTKPFQPEYPGNRTWNRNAPQYAFEPQKPPSIEGDDLMTGFEKSCPNWNRLLTHLGEGLDDAITENKWCKENKIKGGKAYLFLWIASLFNFPCEPLPYLFFYSSEQNTGKSTFHEALSLLLKDGVGYIKADISLTSPGRFNSELENAVVCAVEETHLGTVGTAGKSHFTQAKEAYNRIKDWVTSPQILIHPKGKVPYLVVNTTHWIQCSNDIDSCPIFPGDTRIVLIHVNKFGSQPQVDVSLERGVGETKGCKCTLIPEKKYFMRLLEIEGPQFLWWLLNTEIPPIESRLRIPVISSAEKIEMMFSNESPVLLFLKEKVHPSQGNVILLEELYEKFIDWLPFDRRRMWTRKGFYNCLPDWLIRGKWKTSSWAAANVSFNKEQPIGVKLIKVHDKIIEDQ